MQLLVFNTAAEFRSMASELEELGYSQLHLVGDFNEIGDQLLDGEKTYSDITHVAEWLAANESCRIGVESFLLQATEHAVFLCNSKWAASLLDWFPGISFETEVVNHQNAIPASRCKLARRPLYAYPTRSTYESLVQLSENLDNFYFISFSWIQSNPEEFAAKAANSDNEILIDLTSFAATKGQKAVIALEALVSTLPANVQFLARSSDTGELYEDLPSVFDSVKEVSEKYQLSISPQVETTSNHKSVCSLSQEELDEFLETFDDRLTGHGRFKKELALKLESFALSNRLKDQRIFSLFLFGESGVGKTEVARLFNDILDSSSHLAKINFESYSSQDSLNSLIGSPAGYIGCEGGELNDKLSRSKTKVLLCDEFEKTDRKVQNFFLELLEDGFYTDRMGVEHDLDGYVIVFTSNIKSAKDFSESIAPELRTRFDLVCEFVQPSTSEKISFASKLALSKANQYARELSLAAPLDVSDICPSPLEAENLSMREINKRTTAKVAEKAALALKSSTGAIQP